MNKAKWAIVGLVTATATLVIATSPAISVPHNSSEIENDVIAGYVVIDVESGQTVLEGREHYQFRSASIVKLLIALDYLVSLGPNKKIPEEDEALLEPMLRSSNDDAASVFWVRGGFTAIIDRMVAEIGLGDTEPPTSPGMWGYTAISAADVAKIYQYILHEAHPQFREFMLSNLHKHTKCADDGFDQTFGLASAVEVGAVKQGWSGFGAGPRPGEQCQESSDDPTLTASLLGSPEVKRARGTAPGEANPSVSPRIGDIDLERPAMHTTGTVDGEQKIIVLLTLEPKGTDWLTSTERTTKIAKALYRASTAITARSGTAENNQPATDLAPHAPVI